MSEVREENEVNLPKFSTVIAIILVPLILILCSTLSEYIPGLKGIRPVLEFVGTPFVALIIAVLCAMYFLGKKQGYDGEQLKENYGSFTPPNGTDSAGDHRRRDHPLGCFRTVEWAILSARHWKKADLPLILAAFLIAALVQSFGWRSSRSDDDGGRDHGIYAGSCGIFHRLYLAAMVCAITGGATAFSHVNDSGFWLVSSLLEIDEKTTLKSWTIMETIIGFTGLVCALVISLFA